MKFDMGMTREERLKRLEDWHRWFAWHPVRAGRYRVWLEIVERRGERLYDGIGCNWSWEYRNLLEGETWC